MTPEPLELKKPTCHIPEQDKIDITIIGNRLVIKHGAKKTRYKAVIYKENNKPALVELKK
jgi:hypothetical protein